MKRKHQLKKEQGFTIIEVMIVLAIAALILLIVFLAVPALQRSQRNTARNSDAGRIAAAVVDWSSSHNNSLPNECVNFPTTYGTLAQFTGLVCTAQAAVAANPAANTLTVVTAGPVAGTLTIPPQGNAVELIPVSKCDPANTTNNGYLVAGSTNAALFYSTESGNTWAWNCKNPQ